MGADDRKFSGPYKGVVVSNVDPYSYGRLLVRVQDGGGSFADPVKSAMTDRLETFQPSASFHHLRSILDRGEVAIILDGDHFVGLITRIDMLNYLRRKV